MMDQTTMHAAVAVLEGVNVDKTESRGRCFQHGVRIVFMHPVVGFQ
jgi:hypothetical protein